MTSTINSEQYLRWLTSTPPQMSLVWVKELDVCYRTCHQDFIWD